MIRNFAHLMGRLCGVTLLANALVPGVAAHEGTLANPDGMIDLLHAPAKPFEGAVFLLNDWDGGDKDNQMVGEEVNRKSRIAEGVILLSDVPGRNPKKIAVADLEKDANVLAQATRQGPIAIALGGHSRHVLAWLTALPKEQYNFANIVVVTHSNWNELDGRAGYDANFKPGDQPLGDTHGVDLRRGLYANLARVSDLGVAIWEIERTDHGPGGWGGRVDKAGGGQAEIKALDISDLGLVYYLKTGKTTATREERNAYVSPVMQKAAALDQQDGAAITRFWASNYGVPGEAENYAAHK